MAERVIDNPTYMEHIRNYFEQQDFNCMVDKGVDLSSYKGLVDRANSIYFQTKPPSAKMPPQSERKWSKERSDTFLNWIKSGHPRGRPKIGVPKVGSATRIRKNASDLNDTEISLLVKAFEGIMERDTSDPKSYFSIAGLHWYPEPSRCEHHTPLYNPWHRAYLQVFEDALRSIEGCEDVTLPYWDITQRPPSFLFKKPFLSYTLPEDVHPKFKNGFHTKHYTAAAISRNVKNSGIVGIIDKALESDSWEGFSNHIEAAHDSGHPACGSTMATPDIAAFDPLFWFFHSNWDRLWWRWQQLIGGADYWSFRSTITTETDFLETPLNKLVPFQFTSDKVIDLNSINVSYAIPSASEIGVFEKSAFGSVIASARMETHASNDLSVRVKGIQRLNIPGTFFVSLRSNGKLVSKKTFFQSFSPKECATCRKGAIINIDFIIDAERILGKELGIQIDVVKLDGGTSPFPLSSAGSPTVNVRALLR